MNTADLPPNERARLRALQRLDVLDTPAEADFDAIVEIAASICGTPIALISLIDEERQWFKAEFGLRGWRQRPRDTAFCSYALLQPDIMIVPDALADDRFVDNPLVTGEPKIRFYAGAPLVDVDGLAYGTLSVLDRRPRDLTIAQQAALQKLGRVVTRLLERRRDEARLQTYLAAFEQSPVAAIICDASRPLSPILHANGAFLSLTGYRDDEVRGRHYDFIFGDYAQAGVAHLRAAESHGHRGRARAQVFHKQGKRILCDVTLYPLRDEAGRSTHYVGSFVDVTPSEHDRQLLLQSEARFRTLSESAHLGVFHTDPRGRCTYTNARWRRITGLDVDAALGDGWLDAIHADDRDSARANWQAAINERTDVTIECRFHHPDGSGFAAIMRVLAIRTPDGMLTGFVGTIEAASTPGAA